MTTARIAFLTTTIVASLAAVSVAQRPALSDATKAYVKIDAPVAALTNVRVIDGTGAAPRDKQTIVIDGSEIKAIGETGTISVPSNATVIDLAGKTVIPGFVMLHEHLFYTSGAGVYGQLGESFSRLYLAGGVTTMRTGGNLNGFMDFKLKQQIESGAKPGPAIDATAPYVNGPNNFVQMHTVTTPDEARRHVAYWADVGATSVKAYMQISRANLGAAIEEAHKRKMKVTGHLCSVTYSEAADLGIDNLEHGFRASTDFVADKQPDVCPGPQRAQAALAALDEHGEPFRQLVRKLIDKGVAITSTPTVFETLAPGRPLPPGLDVLTPQLKQQFEAARARAAKSEDGSRADVFQKMLRLEHAFAKAGGLLVLGTDPTGSGGVIPGFANQRAVELMVEAGFTPVEAISIATLNGAKYLGREKRIGTLAAGKQADFVVLNADPSVSIAGIRQVDTVFRAGIGYDPAKLVASVSGRVGLW